MKNLFIYLFLFSICFCQFLSADDLLGKDVPIVFSWDNNSERIKFNGEEVSQKQIDAAAFPEEVKKAIKNFLQGEWHVTVSNSNPRGGFQELRIDENGDLWVPKKKKDRVDPLVKKEPVKQPEKKQTPKQETKKTVKEPAPEKKQTPVVDPDPSQQVPSQIPAKVEQRSVKQPNTVEEFDFEPTEEVSNENFFEKKMGENLYQATIYAENFDKVFKVYQLPRSPLNVGDLGIEFLVDGKFFRKGDKFVYSFVDSKRGVWYRFIQKDRRTGHNVIREVFLMESSRRNNGIKAKEYWVQPLEKGPHHVFVENSGRMFIEEEGSPLNGWHLLFNGIYAEDDTQGPYRLWIQAIKPNPTSDKDIVRCVPVEENPTSFPDYPLWLKKAEGFNKFFPSANVQD